MTEPIECACLDQTVKRQHPAEHDPQCPVFRLHFAKQQQDPRRQHKSAGPGGGRERKPL